MLRTAHLVAGLSLALTCGAANAQLAAHKDLTLPIAVAMAQTAVQTCTAQGFKVSAHVLGRNAEVLVAMRGDGTGPHTMENSMRKAYTARMQRRPSGELAPAAQHNHTRATR